MYGTKAVTASLAMDVHLHVFFTWDIEELAFLVLSAISFCDETVQRAPHTVATSADANSL